MSVFCCDMFAVCSFIYAVPRLEYSRRGFDHMFYMKYSQCGLTIWVLFVTSADEASLGTRQSRHFCPRLYVEHFFAKVSCCFVSKKRWLCYYKTRRFQSPRIERSNDASTKFRKSTGRNIPALAKPDVRMLNKLWTDVFRHYIAASCYTVNLGIDLNKRRLLKAHP